MGLPRDPGIDKVLILGSGPIIIGQAAEFDYSGTQACRALREEGCRVVLVNPNPASLQTTPETADRTYLEPLTLPSVRRILEVERPDGVLAGMGGQTALNLATELWDGGVLKELGLGLLGINIHAIRYAEDRELFAELLRSIGEPIPRGRACRAAEEAGGMAGAVGGLPAVVRPAYTLGGSGGGIARTHDELDRIVRIGLARSQVHQVLIEEYLGGWLEYEYEIMRDRADNCISVCNMENLDPMGVHTGESIVVAPAQTLADGEHQILRNASFRIIRALELEGGCNIQFAVHPTTREYRVIEVNPRVSRSSALASKATGYPIARLAAKIAVGLTLDEIPNPVTRSTLASFEPALDYVVTKIPRWPFDKFQTVDRRIGTSMKSTGEAMGIGRTFEESLLKAIRSSETRRQALEPLEVSDDELLEELENPTDRRLWAIAEALRRGFPVEKVGALTHWDPFFLRRVAAMVAPDYKPPVARTFKIVDTCAAEFPAQTPYYYSTADGPSDFAPLGGRKVVVVGSGPIRIGQGQEFDTVCTEGVLALREEGYRALMVNCNPETVSTDFDMSDRLYFEPLTLGDVLAIVEAERPEGIILQFGGQTSINLAVPLEKAMRGRGLETRVLGTTPDAIDLAEDRRRFSRLMEELGIKQAPYATGFSFREVREAAVAIGFPVLVRPSYVLGGRGMELVHSEEELERYITAAADISGEHPILVDKFLSHAVEVDVDALCDGTDTFIAGIQEHIEEAGVHSGDAAAVLPPQALPAAVLEEIKSVTRRITKALGVVGLVNIQMAVKEGEVYVLEANPRASRTVPFVSRATGIPLAKVATKVMLGQGLRTLGLVGEASMEGVAVKVPVFPFQKLPGVDCILGPEMKSTGEAMGIDTTLGRAYYKAMEAAGNPLPRGGGVYITVRDEDKPAVAEAARRFARVGLTVYATKGTAAFLREQGIAATTVYRISEGQYPDALGLMRRGEVKLVINTPTELTGPRRDAYMMRRLAVDLGIPFITTPQGALAAAAALEAVATGELSVVALQDRKHSSWPST